MKFAMVPINTKSILNESGTYDQHIRRVLISYKFKLHKKDKTFYYGTKFILADQYFYAYDSSHEYEFKNGYYKLISVDTINPNASIYDKKLFKKRRYHNVDYIAGKIEDEFKANNIQAAIEKFNHRNELR